MRLWTIFPSEPGWKRTRPWTSVDATQSQFHTQKCPGFLRIPGTMLLLRDRCRCLDGGNVLRLPALGALGHVELHGLAFLQALEAASLNRGEVHENVFAILTADKAVALGVIKPLHCSLFCH